MKLLIKKLLNNELITYIRNSLLLRPVFLQHYDLEYSTSISDSFLWRTDNGFITKFKFSDIISLFYKFNNSRVEIHFFSKTNQLIKIFKINRLEISNELEISPKFLNNIEDYGTFYIYHFIDKKNDILDNDVISNRCYVGYSLNNSLYSYMHGNTLAKYVDINNQYGIKSNIVKLSLFQNHKYTIQKYFKGFDKTELFFVNPTDKKIRFTIEGKNNNLPSFHVKIIKIKNEIVSFKSNCLFLRPVVFSHLGKYYDVHHS